MGLQKKCVPIMESYIAMEERPSTAAAYFSKICYHPKCLGSTSSQVYYHTEKVSKHKHMPKEQLLIVNCNVG
jgi:hypothetical protein